MKGFVRSVLPLAVLFTAALSAPTPSNGPSFPITDLIGTDLTIEEYAQQLEGQSTEEPALTKRQYGGNTYNQLTDGTPCREITLIYARGTTQDGNVGAATDEGPTFFNALASRLGGTSRLAIQGVTYPANVLGFLAGGDAAGATTMFNLINTVSIVAYKHWCHMDAGTDFPQAASKCPSTKIVVSGYSQGAQLVHTATQRLSAATAARVNAG